MAKRFRDTELHRRIWYMALTCAEQKVVDYVFDTCDLVGMWRPSPEIDNQIIKEPVDWAAVPGKTNGNIVVMKSGKWWVPDFCYFQYGVLNPSCPPHRKYISMLKEYGLYERVLKGMKGYERVAKGFGKAFERVQEEEEEKEKEEEEKDQRSALGSRSRDNEVADFLAGVMPEAASLVHAFKNGRGK